MKQTVFFAEGYEERPRSELLVTSVRLTEGPAHDRLELWNRGGKAGELVLSLGDGRALVARILPRYREERNDG